jgi:hypothetical protein
MPEILTALSEAIASFPRTRDWTPAFAGVTVLIDGNLLSQQHWDQVRGDHAVGVTISAKGTKILATAIAAWPIL